MDGTISEESATIKTEKPGPEKKKGKSGILQQALRVIVIFGVAVIGFHYEAIQDSISWLHDLDVRSYNWISSFEVRKPRPQWVIGVEIDDETFFGYLKRIQGDVTDRNALSKLVDKAVSADAAVIVLDIDLSKETPDLTGSRKSQNDLLLASIKTAEHMHVPVVLGFGFVNADPTRHPQEYIFSDQDLPDINNDSIPYRVRFGFDLGGADLRTVPLVAPGTDIDGHKAIYTSLALQAVDAYEATVGITPRTKDALSNQIRNYKPIYTSFLPQQQFPKVSAKDILTDQKGAAELLRHRIVIIGGNRHFSKNSNAWRDSYVIPPLEMRGMYFHANRIEGLLDNRIRIPVSRWTAFWLDLALGSLMLYYSTHGNGLGARFGRLGIFFIPILLAYIASANLGYVLDCVAPLLLLLLHGFLDHYLELRFAVH